MSASTSCSMPYKTFLSEISDSDPALQNVQSLSLGLESEIDRSVAIAKFSYLLSFLDVAGPCTAYDSSREETSLGRGAQFKVVMQPVTSLVSSGISTTTSTKGVGLAAVKTPLLFAHAQQKLDLSSPGVSRQVRNLIIEITALCHPSLRGHRNIVDLWGWGSGLDALHEIGLIHGDLKPENVLMFYKFGHWVAKLADFGGGADLGDGGNLEGRGTVGWRAPELRKFSNDGAYIDPSLLDKVDNYSYGLLLWSIFFREKGSAPCAESDEAGLTALSEIQTNLVSLPIRLKSVLNSSLDLLLKQDPKQRPKTVGHLLDDGSRAHAAWELLDSLENKKPLEQRLEAEDNKLNALPEGYDIRYDRETPDMNDIYYDWEIPEISLYNVNALRSAFLRHEPTSTEMIHSLFLKFAGYRDEVRYHVPNHRDLLFNLLYTGSKQGSKVLRGLIYTVHEYFQVPPNSDVLDTKLLWLSDAVARGSFFLRKPLGHLDGSLLEESVQKFQDRGGYNIFYAELNRETVSDVVLRTSSVSSTFLDWKTPLNRQGDKLLHILSSTTTFKNLGQTIKLTGPQELNEVNGWGETALYCACRAGATAHVLALLSHGADPSIACSQGATCLHWLFHFSPRDVDIVAKELVAHGAPKDAQCDGRFPMLHYPFTLPIGTPLHWAVENSALEATRALIHQGADPSIRDGTDPYRYDDNVRHLEWEMPPDNILYSEADHDTLGLNVIDLAVMNRDHEILAVLLSNDSKVDPADTDEEGYSAMHRLDAGEWLYTLQGTAIYRRMFQGPPWSQADSLKKTIATLIQHGFELDRLTYPKASTESRLGFSDQTALMIAVSYGAVETVRQLIDAGADVNIANSVGDTALMSLSHYSESKHREITSLLLDAKPNVHARNEVGWTALLKASTEGISASALIGSATALLDYGAHLNDRVYGKTALAYMALSCRGEKAQIDEWLQAQLCTRILPRIAATDDASLNMELLEKADLDGGTLLHYTAKEGLIRSCVVLLQAGVSLNSIRAGVNTNSMRRKIWGKEVIFRTALDDANDSLQECIKAADATDVRYQRESAKREVALRDVVELLRKEGAVESQQLIAEQFGIPPLRPDNLNRLSKN